jgi:hypothetical protein
MADEAHEIAVEHCLWTAQHGATARAVINSVKFPWSGREPTWEDAQLVIRVSWRQLQSDEPVKLGW